MTDKIKLKPYEVVFHLNLILQDLNPAVKKKDIATISALPNRRNDPRYFDIIRDQIVRITAEMSDISKLVEKSITPARWHKIVSRIKKISKAVERIHEQKNIDHMINALSLEAIKIEAQTMGRTAEEVGHLLQAVFDAKANPPEEKKEQKIPPQGWGGWIGSKLGGGARVLGSGFKAAVGAAANTIAKKLESFVFDEKQLIEISPIADLKIRSIEESLFATNQNTVLQSFAKVAAQYITFWIRDEVLDIESREPWLRSDAFEIFFKDMALQKPERSLLGERVIPLLEKHSAVIEKVIQFNILQALKTAYTNVGELQRLDPWFLPSIIHKVLHDGIIQVEDVLAPGVLPDEEIAPLSKEAVHEEAKDPGVALREAFINETVQKKIAHALLTFACPKKENGLELFEIISERLPIRSLLWGLVEDFTSFEIKKAVRQFGLNEDFKNLLLDKLFSVAGDFLRGEWIADKPISEKKKEKLGAEGVILAVPGALFLFLQTLLSNISLAVSAKPLKKSEEDPVAQAHHERLAAEIDKSLKIIQNGTKSPALRLLLRYQSKNLASSASAFLVQALGEFDWQKLLVDLLAEFLEKSIAPGGDWKGEGSERRYVAAFKSSPRNREEYDLQKNEEATRFALLESQVARSKRSIGDSVAGLIEIAYNAVKMEDPKAPPPDAKDIRMAIFAIKNFITSIVNGCLLKLIKFMFRIAKVQESIYDLGQLASRTIEEVEQDALVLATAEFAAQELERMTPIPIINIDPK